ncbi:MAG: hypothetical protein ACI8RZ_007148 [Myxococcota bacterium]|jgi:hypothetical protein
MLDVVSTHRRILAAALFTSSSWQREISHLFTGDYGAAVDVVLEALEADDARTLTLLRRVTNEAHLGTAAGGNLAVYRDPWSHWILVLDVTTGMVLQSRHKMARFWIDEDVGLLHDLDGGFHTIAFDRELAEVA